MNPTNTAKALKKRVEDDAWDKHGFPKFCPKCWVKNGEKIQTWVTESGYPIIYCDKECGFEYDCDPYHWTS